MEKHQHGADCGCSEEAKRQDPFGLDLFAHIDMEAVDCFNQKNNDSIKSVIRPLEDRAWFQRAANQSEESKEETKEQRVFCQSGYGKDLVVFIPFNKREIKVKAVIVIGGEDGTAPSKMKVYKNEQAVDINILEEKKPVQTIDMNENPTGELEYLLNVSKFNNTDNIVLGFDENFGAKNTVIKYIALKGEKLREKIKVIETVYEVRANLADHKNPDDFLAKNNLGM